MASYQMSLVLSFRCRLCYLNWLKHMNHHKARAFNSGESRAFKPELSNVGGASHEYMYLATSSVETVQCFDPWYTSRNSLSLSPQECIALSAHDS